MPATYLHQKPGQRLAFVPDAEPALIAETLVALANSEGGTLVLGANPDGRLGTIFTSDEAADAVMAAERICQPPVKTQWHQEQAPGGAVVILLVERSTRVHRMADGRVLVRRGAENAPADDGEIDRLLANRSADEFEVQPVPGATRDDLDEDVIEQYLERRQRRSPTRSILPKDKLLQQIGALTEDGAPTVSGLLLFGREPQLFMPHARAVFVKFPHTEPRGPEGNLGYGRREEFVGPLPEIIERAFGVVVQEMDKRAVVRGLQRTEETEYPDLVVREALVNAICHRDYRITGRGVEIRMYTDRLEIISPGGLPAHITLDNIVEEHYSRNPRIVNALYYWRYIEELGLGVDMMIEVMAKNGLQPPVFDAKPHRFMVTLYNKRNLLLSGQAWENNMNERQLKALEFVQQNGSISNSDYRTLCPHVGPETLRLDLADLVNRGLLLMIGEKRGTRYILK